MILAVPIGGSSSALVNMTVQRTVAIIDMCTSGQYKCGTPPMCSPVPCSLLLLIPGLGSSNNPLSSRYGSVEAVTPPNITAILPVWFQGQNRPFQLISDGQSAIPGPLGPNLVEPLVSGSHRRLQSLSQRTMHAAGPSHLIGSPLDLLLDQVWGLTRCGA